jgi:hypothetical protein
MNLVKYLFFACWAGCLASWIFGFYAMIRLVNSKSGAPPTKVPPIFVARYWLSNAYLFEGEIPWRKRLLFGLGFFLSLGAVGMALVSLGMTMQGNG